MARNEWINSYLEAILDVGTSNKKRFESNSKIVQKLGDMDRKDNQEKVFSPIKYFVEEVVNSFDESDLYKTWIKVRSSNLFPFTNDMNTKRILFHITKCLWLMVE